MAKKLSSVVGIDIGSRSIKVAEIKAQGRDAVITAIGAIDTPEGAVDHTGIFNSDAVAVALKQLLSDCGATTPSAVASISGQASVLVRTLEVPKMSPNELKEHMTWEINRNIPFSESTVVSDFAPLGGEDPVSPNMDVVMAISPQSAIDTLISCVKKAGRTLAAIDVEPLSLARSVTMSYADLFGNESVCLIDVGHKTTAINIYKEGRILMPRQVPVGGELFTKALLDNLTPSTEDALRVKHEVADISVLASASAPSAATFMPYNPFSDEAPGDAGDAPMAPAPVPPDGSDAEKAARAMSDIVDEFVAEIRRSIDYFRSRGGDVSRMALCGGGSGLRGMAGVLQKSIDLPCELYDPFRRLSVNARKIQPGFIEERGREFAVAIGNGLHIFF